MLLQTLQNPQIVLAQSAPVWLVLLFALFCIVMGVVIGRKYCHGAKVQADTIEGAMKQLQGEYDLVSRDVVKLRQDVTVLMKRTNS